MHINRSDNVPAFASPHGEVVYELIGNKAGGSNRHSLAQIVLPPGKASRKHYHPEAEESYYILSGHGKVKLGDESQNLTAGDTIMIPTGIVHQIFNTSTGNELLIFLAICQPAWTPDNSVYLD